MDKVIIGVGPHKLSVTFEVRDTREVLRATGRFGTDARSYRQLLSHVPQGVNVQRPGRTNKLTPTSAGAHSESPGPPS